MSTKQDITGGGSRRSTLFQGWYWPVLAVVAVAIAAFAPELFAQSNSLPGGVGKDLHGQLHMWREFGFSSLSRGDFPMWIPNIFGGAPYHGGVQSALLYPVNWVHLVLPRAIALRIEILLNMLIMGWGVLFWIRSLGYRWWVAVLSAITGMCGGFYFWHIYPGHLPNLASMAWFPVVMLALDRWLDGPRARRDGIWVLLGAAAVAMQIIAGHPQYVFYCAIAACLHAFLRLATLWWRERRVPLSAAAGICAIYVLGAAMAAVQLLPAVEASAATLRSERLSFDFVSMLGLPPENLATLLLPGLFGHASGYWGSGLQWEHCLFVGVVNLLVVIAAFRRPLTPTFFPRILTVAACILLALGAATPLLRLLYDFAPGFDRFRGLTKFVFPAVVMFLPVVAEGWSRIASGNPLPKRTAWVFAAALFAAALGAWIGGEAFARVFVAAASAGPDRYFDLSALDDPSFLQGAKATICGSLAVAGLTAAIAAAVMVLDTRLGRKITVGILGGLAALEVVGFAWTTTDSFDSSWLLLPGIETHVKSHPGDFRMHYAPAPNNSFLAGGSDIWGVDPGIVKRYAELMAALQGLPVSPLQQNDNIQRITDRFGMLGLRFIYQLNGKDLVINEVPNPTPRAVLINDYSVKTKREDVLAAVVAPDFDPAQSVILETEPVPRPMQGPLQGSAEIVSEFSDELVVEAQCSQSALLVIRDTWTPSWEAVPLPGSSQQSYSVMPANWAFRAIPLEAGTHKILLRYRDASLKTGGGISLAALLVWIAAGLFLCGQPFHKKRKQS